jgi:hypothetical protein
MRFLSLGALVPAALALTQSSAAGSLRGSVSSAQGIPLAGAEVRYLSVAASVAAGIRTTPAPGENVVNGVVSTDASGAFAVADLPAATYLLCATVPSAPYLDPCVWGRPVRAVVSAAAITTQDLVLERGVYLNVRVNDPMGPLPQVVDGPWTPRKLLVGVAYGKGAYQGAQNTSVDPDGRSYQLIVPTGRKFLLRLYSADVALADAAGAAVGAPAAGYAFEASAGQDQSFTFAVSGPSRAQ